MLHRLWISCLGFSCILVYSSAAWALPESKPIAPVSDPDPNPTYYIASEECGNFFLENAEECDDGNTNNGDGCSSICTRESNIYPTLSPTSELPVPNPVPIDSASEDPQATIQPCRDCDEEPIKTTAVDGVELPESDPDPYSFLDNDYDGLSNGQEESYGTDPNNADSDDDGFLDSEEVKAAYMFDLVPSDPNDPDSTPHVALLSAPAEAEVHKEDLPDKPGLPPSEPNVEPPTEPQAEPTQTPTAPFCPLPELTKDESLDENFGLLGTLGAGLFSKPCLAEYTYCFNDTVPKEKWSDFQLGIHLGLQVWLRGARNCHPGCPLTIFRRINWTKEKGCTQAMLEVDYIGKQTACWGGPLGNGRGKIWIASWAEPWTFVHEIGHALGLHHTQPIQWRGDQYSPLSPNMSYGHQAGRPQTGCLHPNDSARICKLAAQYWGDQKKIDCGPEETCCLENKDEIELAGGRDKGSRRACWSRPEDNSNTPPPEAEIKYTTCQADDKICTSCKDADGNRIPWVFQYVAETTGTETRQGKCFMGLYCPNAKKYFPGVGQWYLPFGKTKTGELICDPAKVNLR